MMAPRIQNANERPALVQTACHAFWSAIVAGYAAYGRAACGYPPDTSSTRWTEGDLDTLLATAVEARQPRNPAP